VANVARPRSLPGRPLALRPKRAPRRLALALASAAALMLAALLGAAPAGAIVTPVKTGLTTTTVGLQPRTEALGAGALTPFANETGHVVLHGTSVYAIYWDPQNRFHHEWLVRIDSFFQRMGASSGQLNAGFADLGQFRDRSNTGAVYKTVFKASYSDTAKYPIGECTDPNPTFTTKPITCLTDAQLREHLQSFITSHGLPKGMNSIFYLLTPPGVAVCVDAAATRCSDYKVSGGEEGKEERKSPSYKESFCSYHADISPSNEVSGDANTILYAAVPWSAGTAGASRLEPAQRVYKEAFDCQDGGWNPEQHEENREKAKELSPAEEAAFAAGNAEEKAKVERRMQLEGPHQEEPSQEGKGEIGDYAPGLADLIINQIAQEQSNTVTNPLLNAWQDSEGKEVTDECRNRFASTAGPSGGVIGGSVTADEHTEAGKLSNMELSSPELSSGLYYINNVFNLSGSETGSCVGGVGLVARFTAPNPVNSNEIVGVDGMESTVSLLEGQAFAPTGPPSKTYATFSWNFGDGTPEVKGFAPGAPLCEAPWLSPCAASSLHSYQYGGVYTVALTVTDVAGNTSRATHSITVVGPPPPSPSTASSGGGSAGSAPAGGSAPGPGAGSGAKPTPIPAAAAAVASRSLRRALRHGLVVRYSVSERVTGHFEVLLATSLARRLRLHGPTATGLAAGTPQQTVIGKAFLVTAAGGRNTVTIKFSKVTAARLSRVHGVSLMLRLLVRNASSGSAGVITTVTLSR
jgi:hypothetical protein